MFFLDSQMRSCTGVEFSGHHWKGRDISTENSLQDLGWEQMHLAEAQLMHCLNFASMCWSFSHWSWWQNSHGIQQSGVESIQKLFFPEQLCNNQWICKLLTLTHWNNLGLSFHFALIGLSLHLSLPKWVAMPKICAGMFALSEGTWRLNWKAGLC